jgi:hypothetical protein
LAFVGATFRTASVTIGYDIIVYDMAVFLADEDGERVQEVYARQRIKVPRRQLAPGGRFFWSGMSAYLSRHYGHLQWSKDGRYLNFYAPTTDDPLRSAMVAVDDLTLVEEDTMGRGPLSWEDRYHPFEHVSPDGTWEIYRSSTKELSLNPLAYVFYSALLIPPLTVPLMAAAEPTGRHPQGPAWFMVITWPRITWGDRATYLRKRGGIFPAARWRLWLAADARTQWTPDSRYVVVYDSHRATPSFIVSVNGELASLRGVHPSVQPVLPTTP